MPPTHLTNVDFPAPLSPISAVTSPGYAAKSTSRSTCTGPKLLSSPRNSNRGVAFTVAASRSRTRQPGPGGLRTGVPGFHLAPPTQRTPGPQCVADAYLMPSSVHLAANSAVHSSAAVTYPSSTTAL